MTAAGVRARRSVRRQLAELAKSLEAGDGERLNVFGSSDQREQMLRLVGMVLALTTQHQIDKSGRCRQCRDQQAGWRRILPVWSRPTSCMVHSTVQVFARSAAEAVWLRVFALLGEQRSIEDVRTWLLEQENEATTVTLPRVVVEDDGMPNEALLTDSRVRLREERVEPTRGRHSVEEAGASSVSVPDLIAQAVAGGELDRLGWPIDDLDTDQFTQWHEPGHSPSG